MEYKAIDLGLPSGRLWADRNVGAEKETDYGKYFQWGDTTGYTDASHSIWDRCPGNGCYSSFNRGSIAAWDAETLSDRRLKSDFDAATVNMGDKWRMPTHEDYTELINNTNYEVAEINGVKGGKFINKSDASKYIFLPFAGFAANGSFEIQGIGVLIWSSSAYLGTLEYAYYVYAYEFEYGASASFRYFALPVRGVCDSKYDETYLDGLIDKAKKSWEGVDVDNYMKNLRDDSFDKEVVENLSNEVSTYIINQVKANMATIEERAKYAGIVCQYKSDYRYDPRSVESGYMQGATEQKDTDIKRAKDAFNKACGWLSTYTWFNEVFDEFMKNMEE